MKYKLDFKPILGAAAIAIFAVGCGNVSSPSGAASTNNSTADASNPSAPTEVAQTSDRMSDLNLTDAQKTQMKQIREQTKSKIADLLTSDQQAKFNAAADGSHESPMKTLKSLNLSADQKQKVQEIMRDQRQQIQAILTPEQQAKWKQHRGHGWKEQSQSN